MLGSCLRIMSASVTLTKRFEIRSVKKGMLKYNVKVPSEIEIGSKLQKYNIKGYAKIEL